ncbi:sugar transferase [Lachnoanaerobaculum saburreum]|uniref:Exopolysaccharide biosynthesis polyprenyl glycosylphosphotransferase n=1 Tax=Lachnoanaerobaculum saburreum TaxID=467210 RepID=A0A133ZXC5_9FIRM|nr:sugar transferase [Lachnoanaerobaculum saburreum]KXB60084.1 exopolysaccharide biosynthesis polyprenyl glycosylphosphotransferase [Lachnoanaerobaculum saburreum]
MNRKEQYKRILKFGSAAVILLIEVGLYWLLWQLYLNNIIEERFWRRGIWLLSALYGVLLVFFLQTYGGLKIGYLKRGNIIYSHILSLFIVNTIGYFILALIDKRFHSPVSFILLTVVDGIIVCIWVFLFQWIYGVLFPPRRLLVVYGVRPVFSIMEKIGARDDKYVIGGSISIDEGIDKIMAKAKEFEGIVVGDVPSHDRNLILKKCYDSSIRVYMIPKISDILVRSSTNLNLFDTPILLSKNEGLQIDQMAVKRFIDIVVSLIGIILTSPLFVMFGAAIHLADRGPIFYTQTRLTIDGKLFKIYKFRTMRVDAEKDGVARLAGEADNRITDVGKILRATRLDELPQLFNIIKGEMSLVGPRPERPEIAAEYMEDLPEFAMRLKMKAGLTGYAQVHGKYNTTPYDKLKLDLHYIRNYSLWMDLILIVLTPKVLFMKESTEGVGEGETNANNKDK